MPVTITRRTALVGLGGLAAHPTGGFAQALPKVVVTKDPSCGCCGCCGAWVEHMRGAGFPVEVVDVPDVNRVKVRLGIPQALASCHTAEVAGYVVEGHVPAAEVKRLLAEKPAAKGLAVPSMPTGSPGMEMNGMASDTSEVVLFGPSGRSTFALYEGTRAL